MPTVKLNQSSVFNLAANVGIPEYDRNAITTSIVHIGVGGFFRAHQAAYLDDLQHLPGNTEWGYCGVGLLPGDARLHTALQSQDCLYTLVERSATGEHARVIGSLHEFLFAPDNPEAVLKKMADPGCRIVSLTITEGGYYVNEGNATFDANHPDIVYELNNTGAPRCSFGYLAQALERRRLHGLKPFTVMSCDNLQNNGEVCRNMLLAFTALFNPELSAWLEQHGCFPNSMVDRITPATTDEHRQLVQQQFAINDACPVMTEPFRQWVIEDNFSDGRPAWELVGAQMTKDVLPYEKMKLRLLNAGHQALCYIGMLAGYEFAHQAMADPHIRQLLTFMMDVEVTPLLPPVEGIDLEEYKKTLIERFSNPAIRDQLARIGTEGSARIPKFVLPSIREQLARGGSIKALSFTVASWFRYLNGVNDQHQSMPINDPLADRLVRLARQGGSDPRPLLAIVELFGELADSKIFVAEVDMALRNLYEQGSQISLAQMANSVFTQHAI